MKKFEIKSVQVKILAQNNSNYVDSILKTGAQLDGQALKRCPKIRRFMIHIFSIYIHTILGQDSRCVRDTKSTSEHYKQHDVRLSLALTPSFFASIAHHVH